MRLRRLCPCAWQPQGERLSREPPLEHTRASSAAKGRKDSEQVGLPPLHNRLVVSAQRTRRRGAQFGILEVDLKEDSRSVLVRAKVEDLEAVLPNQIHQPHAQPPRWWRRRAQPKEDGRC